MTASTSNTGYPLRLWPQPMNGNDPIAFEDLFDLDEIQRIQDELALATGVASLITRPDGTPITSPSNFTALCSDIIRKTDRGCANCFKSDVAIGRYRPDGPIIQSCLGGGLWNAGASIAVGGHHVGNWLIGQVRDSTQSEDGVRGYAREIGADEEQVIAAFRQVPSMSLARFEQVAKAIFKFANHLATLAFQNVKQARYIEECNRKAAKISGFNESLERRVGQITSELATMKQPLSKAMNAAESANIAKSAFLANVSHEIRTPMNGVIGMASLLKCCGVTPKQAEHLGKIDIAPHHLHAILSDILDLSRIEAGKFILERVPVRLCSIFGNIRSILSGRAKAKNLEFLTDIDPSLPEISGDSTRLQQALLIYATNAVKFTEKGSVILRCRKQEEADDAVLVRFEVQDTGIGISPEVLPRLFSCFEQADNSMTRKYGGTGLSLAITRHIAEMMGGEVGVESTPEEGSTFWFTARLAKQAIGKAAAPSVAGQATHAEAIFMERYAGTHILVVDDDEMSREVVRILLEGRELIVDTAKDGEEAIAMAKARPYSAIYMEMRMLNVDSLAATRRIRELPGYQSAPIIGMTANTLSDDRDRWISAGMNDFLMKPFNPDGLFSTLFRGLVRQKV